MGGAGDAFPAPRAGLGHAGRETQPREFAGVFEDLGDLLALAVTTADVGRRLDRVPRHFIPVVALGVPDVEVEGLRLADALLRGAGVGDRRLHAVHDRRERRHLRDVVGHDRGHQRILNLLERRDGDGRGGKGRGDGCGGLCHWLSLS